MRVRGGWRAEEYRGSGIPPMSPFVGDSGGANLREVIQLGTPAEMRFPVRKLMMCHGLTINNQREGPR